MSATKRRIALDIVATDTHCSGDELCPGENINKGRCRFIRSGLSATPLDFDHTVSLYKRLPECIAAEKAQKASEQP